jgi:sulfur relay protein TusB/DsrH
LSTNPHTTTIALLIAYKYVVDKKIRAYALQADVSARGLQNCISKDVLCISDEEFVALTVEYSTVQSWY